MAPSATLISRTTSPSTPHLPQPPDDDELYWYFGPQRRWVLLFSSFSFVFTAITLFLFSVRTPALWVFLAVLVLNLVALGFSVADGQRQRRLTRAGHEVLVRAWSPAHAPSVDLFLPTCGEPLDVLANAYSHVARMRWRGELTVYVLDDAAGPDVAALAAEFGFRYVVRPDRGHLKKAGNLNHALTIATSDVVAILDADFCPRPDFLDHLVPYLADPAVGIVQSPQFFDTDESMSWLQRAAGAAQIPTPGNGSRRSAASLRTGTWPSKNASNKAAPSPISRSAVPSSGAIIASATPGATRSWTSSARSRGRP
ncbi:HAMP domain-containing protein [Catenulispora sp. MAP5-51]